MRIYVVSDLHVGAGELDDCDAECERQLVAFITRLTEEPGECELVLNGDTFDFVQATPWREKGLEGRSAQGVPLCFTLETSLAKARHIVAAHPSLFGALRGYVGRGDKRLVVMPGNHDVDLYWPEVRELLQQEIQGPVATQHVSWHLHRVYRPHRASRIWIEHGHQYDHANSFFWGKERTEYWSPAGTPILFDTQGARRLFECGGTRFLIRFLNELDARYPFVDNMKPLGKFLNIYLSSLNTLRGGTVLASLTALAFARYALAESLTRPGSFLTSASGNDLGKLLLSIDDASRGGFSRALSNAGLSDEMSFRARCEDSYRAAELLDFALDQSPDVLDIPLASIQMLGGEAGTLALGRGLGVDETKELRSAARKILDVHADVDCVVMGHTHEAVDDPKYKNTGSWTRYWQLPEGVAPSWSEMLNMASHLPLTPRYTEIEAVSGAVQLTEFR